MEEAFPEVERAVPDLFGIKKLETAKTSRAMAPREFSIALPVPEKDWPAKASGRTQNVGAERYQERST